MNVETNAGRNTAWYANDDTQEATQIYLVRHGRTPLNTAGVLRGHLDPALDAMGRLQAEWLGLLLGDRGLRLVVSSPLRRTVETAQAIAARAGIDVEIDPRLIDRDYGKWAGQTKGAVESQWGSLDDAPGVEPAAEAQARAWQAVTDIASRSLGGVAVIVSHDVVIRHTLVACDPHLGSPDQLPQETGCFNILSYAGGRWTVVSINEIPEDPLIAGRTTVSKPNTRALERGSYDNPT